MQESLRLHLYKLEIEYDGKISKEELEQLFFDLDYIQNVEYYRHDTISLGYKSEADRLADEIATMDINIEDKIELCLEIQVLKSDYYISYSIDYLRTNSLMIVAIAYTT